MSEDIEEIKGATSDEEKAQEMDNVNLNNIVLEMMRGLSIQDRKYHGKTYHSCFVGKDAVAWLMSNGVRYVRDLVCGKCGGGIDAG